MATIGDLVVNLAGNVSPLQRVLSVGLSSLSSFAGKAVSLVRPMGALLGNAFNPRAIGGAIRGAVAGIGGMLGSGISSLGGVMSSAVGLFAGPVVAGLGALMTGVTAGLTTSIGAARESVAAQNKLQAVLDSTGGAAGLTAQEISALAGDLQRLTNFEDDATIGAAGVLATFTSIKGDVFKQTLASAQDLSAVMGQDLQSSVMQLGKALNDPIHGVNQLRKVGVSFTKEQIAQIKQLQAAGNIAGAQGIILAEMKKEFGGAAQAMADPLIIMQNMIGDVAENIGGLILPSLNAAVQIAQELLGPIFSGTDGFKELGAEIRDFLLPLFTQWKNVVVAEFTVLGELFSSVFGGMQTTAVEVLTTVKDFLLDSMIVAEFVFKNIGALAQLAFEMALLRALKFSGELEHFFGSVVPTLLQFAWDNWRDIWFTMFDLVSTGFINLGENIRNAWEQIWDYIASGGTADFELNWTPLTDGFRNTIKQLPEIAAREMSPVEQQLQASVDASQANLGNELGDLMNRRHKEFAGLTGQDKKKLTNTATPEETQAEATGKKSKRGVDAAQRDSKEAFSAVAAAIRGESSDPAKRTAKATEKQVENQERTNQLLQKIAERSPDEFEEIDL